MNIATIDIVLILVLLVSVVIGAWRGLLYEVLSVLGWVAAFVLAQWLAVDTADLLPLKGASEPLRYAAGFAIVFIAVAFAAGFIAWLVKKLVESVGLRPVDRTLGALFGLLRGAVLLLGVALVVVMTPLRETEAWRESVGAAALGNTLHTLRPLLPEPLVTYIP
jgi:membrane protein required for colicin V production